MLNPSTIVRSAATAAVAIPLVAGAALVTSTPIGGGNGDGQSGGGDH